MERAVRRSDARYRLLAEASALAVWRADPSGALVTDMPGWRELTGQKPEELSGDGWLEAIPPSDRSRVRLRWRHAVRTGELCDIEYPIVTDDGNHRRIHARGLPIQEEGEIVEWVGIASDITERNEVLAALQREMLAVETLRDMGIVRSAELELARIVSALTDATTTLTGAEFAAFATADAGNGSALPVGSFPAPRDESVFAPTFAGGPPVRVDDLTAGEGLDGPPPFDGLRSHLAVPVVSRSGRVHGRIFLGHSEPGAFSCTSASCRASRPRPPSPWTTPRCTRPSAAPAPMRRRRGTSSSCWPRPAIACRCPST